MGHGKSLLLRSMSALTSYVDDAQALDRDLFSKEVSRTYSHHGELMKKLLTAGVLIAAALPGIAALAATPENFNVQSAADLVEICRTMPNDNVSSAAAGFCQGYVVGVYRTLEEIQAARPRARLFCINQSQHPPSRTEAIAAYVGWMDARPDEMSQPPMESIANYLAATYPCPNSGSSSTTTSRSRVQ